MTKPPLLGKAHRSFRTFIVSVRVPNETLHSEVISFIHEAVTTYSKVQPRNSAFANIMPEHVKVSRVTEV